MKVLFIGDITARPGREILKETLHELQDEFKPDLTIANVENAAHGLGITPNIADDFLGYGIDVMTGGNHLFDRKGIEDYLDTQPRLLRGANYPPQVPGNSIYSGETSGTRFLVTTIIGRTFMNPIDCPFRTFDHIYKESCSDIPVVIIDFHAEASSEKMAMARYVDGRASALIGTHTHVQTADEQILPGGTAYITDTGMTGPHNGIIGMSTESVLPRFLTGLSTHFEPAKGNIQLHAVFLEIDENTGKATSIQRIKRI